MKKYLKILKNIAVSAVIITIAYLVNEFFSSVLHVRGMIPMFYVLGVFIIAIFTEGYIYSIVSALVSAGLAAVMFFTNDSGIEFTFNVITGIVMIIFVALLTCTVTTTLKREKRVRETGERERVRANLIRSASHDLRTPLTSIYASSSAILENFDDLTVEQRLALIEDIRDESHGLIRMVENLLLVTKVDGDVKLVTTDTVVEELVDTVVAKYNRHFPEVPLAIDIPDDFVSVTMEAMLIQQVLFNLLENAVIHAKGMTRLKLKVSVEGENVCFEVSDDGCGIDRDKLNNFFEQSHDVALVSSDRVERRNMGVGLNACYAIIKAHKSTLTVSNNADGGATFKFLLRRTTDE